MTQRSLSLCGRALVKVEHGTEYVMYCTFAAGHSEKCSFVNKRLYGLSAIPNTLFVQ